MNARWDAICAGVVLVLGITAVATAEKPGVRRGAAADFPPGVFSDGGQYRLSDFQGKILVLLFYENDCPTCKGTIMPEVNKIVEQYKDKPVKFIAISPHEPLAAVKGYIAETHLAMPVFADSLNAMETLYGQNISLKNIYQPRIIGPQGSVVALNMKPSSIDAALETVKWKYKDGGYDTGLNQVIDLLEWNQYVAAMRLLQPMRKASSKSLAASAEKLYQAVHAEGEQWQKDADAAAASDPVTAYDLYIRLANVFEKDDLGKAAAEALKKLKDDKTVKAELSAREMYSQLYNAMSRATPQQKGQVIDFCKQVAEKYPNTPTAEKATRLAEALEKAPGNSGM